MKNLIYGSALMMIMAMSVNSFAAPRAHTHNGEKSKTEVRSHYGKKSDMKKGDGKSASCHHHKKSCHKK